MKNTQKKANAVSSLPIAGALISLYYHLPEAWNLPEMDAVFEAQVVGAVGVAFSWLWYRWLDKDRDGIIDFLESDSHGGATQGAGALERGSASAPSELDEALVRLRSLLRKLDA